MCWNQKVSLNTFLLSLFGISLALFNNVIKFYEYLYFLSFISMQLLEYFAWGNLNNKKMNNFLSKIGLFIIFLQPIFFTLSCDMDNKIKTSIIELYLVFCIFCLLYFPVDFSMNKEKNGHLAWNWLRFPTIIIFIWLSFILGLILYKKEYFKFGAYSIIILSIYYTYYKSNTWGSLWCWISNILAIQLIFKVFFDTNMSNCFLLK
jgi:hypothetical protein